MTTSAQIVSLVHQLRGTSSTLQRLKIMALAWRTLRGLSPVERLAVAREIGLEGAEHLVERLVDRSGVSPAELLAALRKAEADHQEPIFAVTEVLGDLLPEAAAGAVAVATATHDRSVDGETEQQPPLPDPFPEALAPAPAPARAKPPAPSPAAAAIPPARAPANQVPQPKPPATPAPAPARSSSSSRPQRRSQPAVAMQPPLEVALLADLAGESSLLARLRLLDHRAGEVHDLETGQLQQLLELFPDGWSRRRAFTQLVQADALGSLDDALHLVKRTLTERSALLWSLTILQEWHRPGPEGMQQLLEVAAGDPLLQRRLGLRCAG